MLLPDEAREITRIVSDPPPSEKIAAAQRQFEPTVDAIQTMSARDFSNLSETEKSAVVKRQYERTMHDSEALTRLAEFGEKGKARRGPRSHRDVGTATHAITHEGTPQEGRK